MRAGLSATALRCRGVSGFTLIEVMIAILVMGIGLLGFALLQTMNVRFTQSANQRTLATNLAYDLLDQMRSNRLLAAQYTAASFNASATGTDCTHGTGTVAISTNVARWQCNVRSALGEGSSATVTYSNGDATVLLTWGDQRWEKDSLRKNGSYETGKLQLATRL